MQSDRATEHLEVIRTLMERSTLYRRALAPMMLSTGGIGTVAAIVGCACHGVLGGNGGNEQLFVAYWLGVALFAIGFALFLVRRQAVKAGESFWSLPTRRVVRAALPAGSSGLVLGLVVLGVLCAKPRGFEQWRVAALLDLPLAWVVLYGCGLHAAGFFMPRGIKWFGWVLVLGGWALFAALHLHAFEVVGWRAIDLGIWAHGVMGCFFGLLHLAYAAYLARSEPSLPAA